jgi:hypothetical protein
LRDVGGFGAQLLSKLPETGVSPSGDFGQTGRVLIDSRRGVKLGVRESRAAVAVPRPKPAAGTAFPPRRLTLHGREVFELSLWCGTCPALLRKLAEPDAADLRVANLSLDAGLPRIKKHVLRAYGQLLPKSTYTVLLLDVQPEAIHPGGGRDYFVKEQVATWGVDPLVGSGEAAESAYYRSFETPIDNERHLYELIVPMVPPNWNASSVVAAYEQRRQNVPPTAVAYSLLDVLAPAVDDGQDWYWHWLLQHFLLDGHHKIDAASRSGQPVRLLSFIDEAISMANPPEVVRMVQARAGRAAPRGSAGGR